MIKTTLIAFNLLIAVSCFCQTTANIPLPGSLVAKLAAFENSNSNALAVIELTKMLTDEKLNDNDKLAVQTTLVHKLQEQKKWDTCLQYCQQQLVLSQQQKNSLAEASFYKLIGNTYYNIPEKERAIEYWKKCIVISESNHHNILLEQCYHNVGSVILESGMNYPEAEKNFQKAIELSIANKTDTTELGNLHYRLLATLYGETNQLKKAADLYQKVIAKARQLNDSVRIAEALMFYAVVLSREKKYDEAIATGKEALLISQRFSKLDMEQTALGLLSSNYMESGNYKEAYKFLYEQNESFRIRFNTDLNTKISEAEAQFKNAEIQHEKEMAVVKARKEKQFYLLSGIGLLALVGFAFYYFYQKRNLKQKLQMQQQVQQEKERLSRDLHDNLGSQMALLSNTIETLDINYKKQNSVADNIENVKDTSKQLLQTLRETIWILNKEQVSTQDFFDKLVDYTHRYLQQSGKMKLQIDENFAADKMLTSNEALQLFRICQEAITNACKYSGSDTLQLTGATSGNFLEIEIKDEGKGFDASVDDGAAHYGLKNMQQRANEIGAQLKIEAASGRGVSVKIIV